MQCPRVALSGLTLHSDETHIDDVIDDVIDDGEEQPHTSGGGGGGDARPLPRPSRRKRRLRGSGRHASESPSSSLKCGVSGLVWRAALAHPVHLPLADPHPPLGRTRHRAQGGEGGEEAGGRGSRGGRGAGAGRGAGRGLAV